MADERHSDGVGSGIDDDRLLAWALGLEADPALEAAAAADEELRRRLDAARIGVADVAEQVNAAVPLLGDDYAAPGDPRWAGLQEYLRAPRTAPVRTRGRRRLRWLAPVAAALVVAVVVGVTLTQRQGAQTATQSARPALEAGGVPSADAEGGSARSLTVTSRFDEFALVVVARARAVDGAFQRFAVVRILKGTAPRSLRLRVADRPAAVGRLHLLLLSPLADRAASSAPEPGIIVAGGPPVTYAYMGDPALAQELPAGTDPESVRLP